MPAPRKANITLTAPLLAIDQESERLGVSLTRLLSYDVSRYREMAECALPELTQWQWGLLSHALDGWEFSSLMEDHRPDPAPPSAQFIASAIDDWGRGAHDDADIAAAGKLRAMVLGWSPLTIAGVLHRLRRG